MRSIKWKLTLMYLGLVLIVMIFSGTYILLSLENIEISKSRAQLESYAEKIREQVVLSYEEDRFSDGLLSFSEADGSRMEGSILDRHGNTLASTAVTQPPWPDYNNSVVITAMTGETSFDAEGSEEWMRYALPVTVGDEVKYIIFAQTDATDLRETTSQTRNTILISVLLALGLTAIMGYVFSRTLTGPILTLSNQAKALAGGAPDRVLEVKSSDEIGQLTQSFNDMSAALSKNMSDISREKNKLEIILQNMTDGVVTYDSHGQLILSNTAALSMLETETMYPSLVSMLSACGLDENMLWDLTPQSGRREVFAVGSKFIQASFSVNVSDSGQSEGVIAVLQDITENRRLDDMRKEFVANVSHELRTPLTTVKSYTETLMDGAIEDKETAMDFLSIIEGEADRMAFLVRDLLQLSRFDNGQYQLNYTTFDLNDFINENLRQNRIHILNKNQHLTFEPFEGKAVITADKDRAAQVFNNILTNAVKYSFEGAHITVRVTEDEKYYRVAVSDTGMGIKKEDLPRIFERFYRVDKARSRAMGGTGLGLAIAKEIMEVHGGTILADSEYGKGTTMTLLFLKTPLKLADEGEDGHE